MSKSWNWNFFSKESVMNLPFILQSAVRFVANSLSTALRAVAESGAIAASMALISRIRAYSAIPFAQETYCIHIGGQEYGTSDRSPRYTNQFACLRPKWECQDHHQWGRRLLLSG